MSDFKLRDGSRVCIVGGGPAGSFAAMHLLRLARARRLSLEVLVFEPREFSTQAGRGSCKGCAGILSNSLINNLETIGLSLPEEVVQSVLRVYQVYLYGHVTRIQQPDPRRRIFSVYRGHGPLVRRADAGRASAVDPSTAPDSTSSFDACLLNWACLRGASLVPARVGAVDWDEDGLLVRTEGGSFPADLLVMATGVNSPTPLSPAFGYQPPQTATMIQAEIVRPPDWPEDQVAGFFGQPRGLAFGAMVPKRRYLSVSLLWHKSPHQSLRHFYASQAEALLHALPAVPDSVCGCAPHIVVRPARTYFGDRWVAIGDAVVARLYKDGINSAFLTAKAAMQTAVEQGVSRHDFQRTYVPACQRIAADNVYGRWMFDLGLEVLGWPLIALACAESVRAESEQALARRLISRILWGMLTGDEPYRDLFRLCLRPRTILNLGHGLLRALRRR